jgi:hypothetical protein
VGGPDFVSHLINSEDALRAGAAGLGIDLKFDESPKDRSKTAAWVIAEREGRCAQLTVWSSGEAEFEAGTVGDATRQEHHDVASLAQLDSLLAELLSAV